MTPASPPLLTVDAIGKAYLSYAKPHQRLINLLLPRPLFAPRVAQVLSGLSFTLSRGETLGIIGRNGAGKSTLLQVICGVLQPSTGQVTVRGKVAALLELGAGFNPDFSGRENIYLNAAIYGLSRQQIDARVEQIIDYSGVGEHIDEPVRHYSSGMYVRLAFSIIVHVDADILIIDEALAVGDALFAQKCMRFLEAFKARGAIIFVSHDSGAVTRLCDRVMWLNQGQCRMEGDPKTVTEAYLQFLYAQQQDVVGASFKSVAPASSETDSSETDSSEMERGGTGETSGSGATGREAPPDPWHDARHDLFEASSLRTDIEVSPFAPEGDAFGTGLVSLDDVRFRDPQGRALNWVIGGRPVVLEVRFGAHADLSELIVGFLVKNRLGQVLFGDNNLLFHHDAPINVQAGRQYLARFELTMPYLAPDQYVISIGIASGKQLEHVQHCWQHDALLFTAQAGHVVHGLLGVPVTGCTITPRQPTP